jgi:hypothetical protein
VLVGLAADAEGDAQAGRLLDALAPFARRVGRLRPPGGAKDRIDALPADVPGPGASLEGGLG